MALEKSRGAKPSPGELVAVIGAGRSGKAAARMLAKRRARVRLLEKNPKALPKNEADALRALGVEIVIGDHKPEHFADAAFVVTSPGIPIAEIKKFLPSPGPEVLSEIELAWRYLDNEPVIAVTGTSGKTTTASLCAAMLKSQGYAVFLGGNIGAPLSEYLLDGRKADALVLEVSSFQLQGCSTFCPRVAILLNISPNHLDYHKNMEEYEEAKFRVFRCQDENDLAVMGADLKELAAEYPTRARVVWLDEITPFENIRLLGAHNAVNAEAAWRAARFFGVSRENAERAAATFPPLPNRLEIVAEKNGVVYVNDSKCTTPAALKVALEAFDRPVRLLCGGKFKGGDLDALRPLVAEKVREIALFGASREIFEKAFGGLASMSWHETLESAMRRLKATAAPGDVILLAPATSSFDLYKNYEERGEDFRRIAKSLA